MLRPHLYLYLSVSIHLSVFVTGDALLCFLERTAVAAGVEQVKHTRLSEARILIHFFSPHYLILGANTLL